MAVEKWVAGAVTSWTTVFGSELNQASFVTGSSIISSTVLTNTAGDMFADVSFSIASLTTISPATLSLFIYPLNQDTTTYGDGQLTTSVLAKTPSASLFAGQFGAPIGTQVVVGTITRVLLPNIGQSFSFAIQNNLGGTIPSTGNAIKWQTYNRSVA
jgi:hypothetical protein